MTLSETPQGQQWRITKEGTEWKEKLRCCWQKKCSCHDKTYKLYTFTVQLLTMCPSVQFSSTAGN